MWRSVCNNAEDPISLEEWADVEDGEDVVSILPERGGEGKGYCMRRRDLIASMKATVVYHWILDPGDDTGEHYGRPDRTRPYYKFPLGQWLTPTSLAALEKRPPSSLFQLVRAGRDRVGTALAASQLHGEQVDLYDLVPVMTKAQWLATRPGAAASASSSARRSPQRGRIASQDAEDVKAAIRDVRVALPAGADRAAAALRALEIAFQRDLDEAMSQSAVMHLVGRQSRSPSRSRGRSPPPRPPRPMSVSHSSARRPSPARPISVSPSSAPRPPARPIFGSRSRVSPSPRARSVSVASSRSSSRSLGRSPARSPLRSSPSAAADESDQDSDQEPEHGERFRDRREVERTAAAFVRRGWARTTLPTARECERYQTNPRRNPRTGRAIVPHARISRFYRRHCIAA